MNMVVTNSPAQKIFRHSEFLSHSHIPDTSIAEFSNQLYSHQKGYFVPKKRKNTKIKL